MDLLNFRTMPQRSERAAIKALIDLKTERFWALMESLIQDGYHPTENIIVLLKDGKNIVKEGNRRIASMKLILGLATGIELPDHIKTLILGISADWKKQNSSVPCAVYPDIEIEVVDAIVSRTHGYDEKAARLQWETVARVRHSRDYAKTSEPALDLLEKFIKHGRTATENQKATWAGVYPLTILEEAVKRLAPCIGYQKSTDLVDEYPKQHATMIDKIVFDIGRDALSFKHIRSSTPFWGDQYGFKAVDSAKSSNSLSAGSVPLSGNNGPVLSSSAPGKSPSSNPAASGVAISSPAGTPTSGKNKAILALPLNDPKSVKRKIKSFRIKGGDGRDKIETLRQELLVLKLQRHPHAFCFVLRSMFELSGKAYCAEFKASGGPNTHDRNGKDRPLAELLDLVSQHILAQSPQDNHKKKLLHGALAVLSHNDSLLSVTSMNQLVHNPNFSVTPGDIAVLFHNIFPLLEAMNS